MIIDITQITNDLIATSSEIVKLGKERLARTNDQFNPQAIMEYMLYLSRAKAKINDLTPKLQYVYNEELAKVTEDIVKQYEKNLKGNSSYIKHLINGKMREFQFALDFTDRISSTINLQSDNCRTIISYLKQELNGN